MVIKAAYGHFISRNPNGAAGVEGYQWVRLTCSGCSDICLSCYLCLYAHCKKEVVILPMLSLSQLQLNDTMSLPQVNDGLFTVIGCLLTTRQFPITAHITLETVYTFHTCIQSQEYRRNKNPITGRHCYVMLNGQMDCCLGYHITPHFLEDCVHILHIPCICLHLPGIERTNMELR